MADAEAGKPPETNATKKKMKSIFGYDAKERYSSCYLCEKLHNDSSTKLTDMHHMICGPANRKLSEKYGLKVRLCIPHHTAGPEAVHLNHEMMEILQKDAQRAFEEHYPNLFFREIFGINYLTDKDREQQKPHNDKIEDNFHRIEIKEEEPW